MRVSVDDIAFMDRRFKLLGGRLGMTWQEALGRCLPVWALAYSKRTAVLSSGDIDALAERPGFAIAMVDVELAEHAVDQDDGVYLAGVRDRIEFLLVQDAKRAKARQAKLDAVGVELPPRPSRGKRIAPRKDPPGPSPGTVPQGGPYSPDLDLTPDLDLAPAEPPARAIPPSRDPEPERPVAPSSASPTPRAALPDAAEVARLRGIGDLAQATWKQLSDLRMQHASKLGLSGVLPLPAIHPGSQPRAFDELRQRIREEGDGARAACDHVLKALDEQAGDKKSIEWLSEKAFLEGSWRTARAAVLGKRKQPAQSPSRTSPVMSTLTPEERAALAAESWAQLYGQPARAGPSPAPPDDPDDETLAESST